MDKEMEPYNRASYWKACLLERVFAYIVEEKWVSYYLNMHFYDKKSEMMMLYGFEC